MKKSKLSNRKSSNLVAKYARTKSRQNPSERREEKRVLNREKKRVRRVTPLVFSPFGTTAVAVNTNGVTH